MSAQSSINDVSGLGRRMLDEQVEDYSGRRLKFPMPFAGIEYMVKAKDQRELDEYVLRLMACDHQHHFAVSGDAIWVSASAIEWGCLKEAKKEPRVDETLAKVMGEATAYDMALHKEIPCNVVWNAPCARVEVEFEATCTIDHGIEWIDDDGNVIFTWVVERTMNIGDIASFSVEFEDGPLL